MELRPDNPFMQAVGPWLQKLRRDSWTMEVEEGEGDPTESRFGGRPWLGKDEGWPDCQSCRKPLPFFFQIETSFLPNPFRKRFPEGLLQMFHCTGYCGNCGEYEGEFLRVLALDEPGVLRDLPSNAERFTARRITGWTKREDYPHLEDLNELGFFIDVEGIEETITSVSWEALGLDMRKTDASLGVLEDYPWASEETKLGGWPDWVQAPEKIECRDCEGPMDFVLQLNGEHHIDYDFGDAGRGQLFQCPEHRETFAFVWACL